MATEVMERPAQQVTGEIMEHVVVGGDLSQLTPIQRVAYYRRVCESLGLNPLTKPFQYIELNRKLTLYATRDATDQLRSLRRISVEKLERETTEGVYVVTAYGRDAQGRVDSATGAVPIDNVKGEARANAIMKAETKAKRRLTLSLAGLGWLDEVEVASVPSAQAVEVDVETGEITNQPKPSLVDSIAAKRAAVETPEHAAAVGGGEPRQDEGAATAAPAVTPIEQNAAAIARDVFAGDVVPDDERAQSEAASRTFPAGQEELPLK